MAKNTDSDLKIPAPTTSAEDAANWTRDLAILEADPRTAGKANRPAALVAKVLGDAAIRDIRKANKAHRELQWIGITGLASTTR